MQLDLAVLQLCNDCVVVKVLGGMVELPDKRVPLLVLCGIVELQLVSKKLRLQWRLQRRRERGQGGRGRWRRKRHRRGREIKGQRGKINIYPCNLCIVLLPNFVCPFHQP